MTPYLRKPAIFSFLRLHQEGQSLIEVVTALSIITIIITAIGIVVISGLNNVRSGKNQDLATKFAQDGLETVRHIRNGNYVNFKAAGGLYCLPQGATDLGAASASCTTPNVGGGSYVRSARIEVNPSCGANMAMVTVTVAWADSKCQSSSDFCHNVTLQSCLATLNPIPAP